MPFGYINQDGDVVISERKYSKCFNNAIRIFGKVINGDLEMLTAERQGDILYIIFSFDSALDEPAERKNLKFQVGIINY